MWGIETLNPWKGLAMTMFTTLRTRMAQRAAYVRTRDAIANLPTEFAIEDLGMYPGDAKAIASKAVYG